MEGFIIKKTFPPISQLNQFPTKIPNPKVCFKLYLIINITCKLSLSASLLYIYAKNVGQVWIGIVNLVTSKNSMSKLVSNNLSEITTANSLLLFPINYFQEK